MTNEMSLILKKYTTGKLNLEQASAELEKIKCDVRLDPARNKLSKKEIAETTVGESPKDVTGYCLLDCGVGSYDKVKVENGQLVNCDMGIGQALVIIGGAMYEVHGTSLVLYK